MKKRDTETDVSRLSCSHVFEQAEYLRISAKHGLHLFLSPDQSNWLKNVRVLDYPKFRLALLEKQTLLEAFLPYAEAVSVKNTAGCPPCRDPHEVSFLALAHQGRADDLVTGDADLLAVTGGTSYVPAGIFSCPIPREKLLFRLFP
jgi:putative PIN family toxin of toxin-antitoxin system